MARISGKCYTFLRRHRANIPDSSLGVQPTDISPAAGRAVTQQARSDAACVGAGRWESLAERRGGGGGSGSGGQGHRLEPCHRPFTLAASA